MDLVSSFVMLITSRLAARPSVYKYPVVSYNTCYTLAIGYPGLTEGVKKLGTNQD